MITAALPENEERRLAALREYQLLDTPPEAVYDAFTRLAAKICQVPIALFSLVDRDRQWFKSRAGITQDSTPRDQAFCAHTILYETPLFVHDATLDDRFHDNPVVAGEPRIRFYAGFPLRSHEGFALGSLCVIDRKPRTLAPRQIEALQELASALQAVLEERRQLLQLFDASYNELYRFDIEQRRFTFASRGALRSLGYEMEELASLHVTDVLAGLPEAQLDGAVAEMLAGRPFRAEVLAIRRDGSRFPVEIHAEINQSAARKQVFMIAVDLTARRAAQSQIDLLLSAINFAGDSIVVYECTPGGDLRAAYANDAFYRQTGYARGEILGRDLEQFRHAIPDDAGMQSVRSAIARCEPLKAELCSYRKDGTSFWNQVTLQPILDSLGSVTHWISVERDITAAVERESNLAEQNVRLLRLGAAARDLFGVLDVTELERRLARAVYDLTGATSAVHPLPAGHEDIALDEQRSRVAMPAGRDHLLEVNAPPGRELGDTDVFVIGLLAQYFGIAAHNASLVSEIDEQRNAVLEVNQVKTDLIAMLAHDFKGPVTNILGYADLTAEMGPVNEHQNEYLESIKRAALRLSDLAADTLALSRLERNEIDLNRENVDVVAVLQEVIAANADQRQLDFTIEQEATVHGDPRRLRQVFYNLIENAIKYSPDGEPVTVSLSSAGGMAVVRVADCGIGIPEKDIKRVFDRFSRAANARRMRITGTGFGLFLANQITAMHGGRIDLQSTEGCGSVFSVILPLRGLEQIAHTLHVAVLERRTESRSFITHALREAGLRTRLVQTLEDLLEIDLRVDRVIVDVDAMPLDAKQLTALEAFGRVHGAGLVVVAAGAPPVSPDVLVLRKPFLMRDLLAAVQLEPTRSKPE